MTAKRQHYRKRGMVRCVDCGWIDAHPETWSVRLAATFATKPVMRSFTISRHGDQCPSRTLT